MLGSFDERTKSCPSKFFSETDLQNATTRLRDLRKSIEDEKIPLASEIGKLEREAQEKRSEVDNIHATIVMLTNRTKRGGKGRR